MWQMEHKHFISGSSLPAPNSTGMKARQIKKKDMILWHSTTWMNLKSTMLREKSKTQKATYCMIPVIWNPFIEKTKSQGQKIEQWLTGAGWWERGPTWAFIPPNSNTEICKWHSEGSPKMTWAVAEWPEHTDSFLTASFKTISVPRTLTLFLGCPWWRQSPFSCVSCGKLR